MSNGAPTNNSLKWLTLLRKTTMTRLQTFLVTSALATLSIGSVPSKTIAETVRNQHGVRRSNLVLCFSHTHTAPHISNGLTNIFSKPLTQQERTDSQNYTDKLVARVVTCVGEAIEHLGWGLGASLLCGAPDRLCLRMEDWCARLGSGHHQRKCEVGSTALSGFFRATGIRVVGLVVAAKGAILS